MLLENLATPQEFMTCDQRVDHSFVGSEDSFAKIREYSTRPKLAYDGLHSLCFVSRGGACRWKLVLKALEGYGKEGTAAAYCEARHGEDEEVFLHTACRNKPPLEVVKAVLRVSPESVRFENGSGQLPIHIACQFGSCDAVIEELVKAFPESKMLVDKPAGRTPLHYALDQQHSVTSVLEMESNVANSICSQWPSPKTVQSVVSYPVMNKEDLSGFTPFLLLMFKIRRLGKTDLRTEQDNNVKSDVETILTILLHFIDPEDDDFNEMSFMTALAILPCGFSKIAILHPNVKNTMNRMISNPFCTFMLLLDVAVAVTLVMVFWVDTIWIVNSLHQALKDRDLSFESHYIAEILLFTGASYLALREILILMGIAQSPHRKALFLEYALYPWKWFDMANIAMLIASTSLLVQVKKQMETASSTPQMFDRMQLLLMVTGGLQFIVVLSKLKSMWYSYAIFVSGFLRVYQTLFPFVVTSFLILGAFAYTHWMAGQTDPECGGADNFDDVITYCTMQGSLMWGFSRFVGGGMWEEDFDDGSTRRHLLLGMIFSFVVVILHLNLLIAVVADSYMHVKDRADEVFWMHRGAFIVESHGIKAFFHICGWPRAKRDNCQRLRKAWDDACFKIIRGSQEHYVREIGFKERTKFGFLRLFLLILILLWVILGTVTLGLLWPPQIREWLFCPSIENHGEKELLGQDTNQIDVLQEKMDELAAQMMTRCERMEDCLDRKVKESEKRLASKLDQIAMDIEQMTRSIQKKMISGKSYIGKETLD